MFALIRTIVVGGFIVALLIAADIHAYRHRADYKPAPVVSTTH